MSHKINQEEDVRKAFDLLADPKEKWIYPEVLGTVLRSLGVNPTEQELSKFVQESDANDLGKIKYEKFLEIYRSKQGEMQTEQEIANAFKVFDREGQGYFFVDQLEYIMTNLGDKLSLDEFNELKSQLNVDGDGMVSMKEFVSLLANTHA